MADFAWSRCELERLDAICFAERVTIVRDQSLFWTCRKFAQAQQQYEEETQRLLQPWVAQLKEKFMRKCEAAADNRQLSCTMDVERPKHLQSRGVTDDLLQQQLQGVLAELGFQDGVTGSLYDSKCAHLTAKWTAAKATSTIPEPNPAATGGTCVTCPICHEHRPAVVLVPCGHLVCRDCHGSKQLRQCPMCRERITSASRGLFMD
eukprot:s5573_g2.t1